ncbi:LCP family protein [Polymorphospora sp. NPDC050346]|uniref:LCP family protein n=1 Tax=Polymorphospora sp. NPDC050346 TaxID=3155780 RepID=UPI00340F9AFD
MTGQGRRRRLVLWCVAIVAAIGLLGGAAVVVEGYLEQRYPISTADLFGPSGPASAAGGGTPTASPTPRPGADLKGPLDILLVGIDTRESVPDWQPNADAIMILRVDADLKSGHLVALPRDLLVDIPAFPASGYRGGRNKINAAMVYGSRQRDGGTPDVARGFQLLARTVSDYTGIDEFDAGAVLNFRGFRNLVDAVGGVDLHIDQRVASIHLRPDGKLRTASRSGGYTGPQMVYEPGLRHLNGWQALDYARQRYDLPNGAYDRQRHHQQLIKALLRGVLTSSMATNPLAVGQVLTAIGDALVFDGRGQRPIDFAFALSDLRPENLTLVGLPGSGVGTGSGYRGEQLDEIGQRYLVELRAGREDEFVAANPSLVLQG